MAIEIEISSSTMAERTDQSADPDVASTDTNDQGVKIKDACTTNGHIRKVTVNGVCYVQMCCGGQWLYWRKGDVWCTCNLGESWTVNCSGNNWIISCR